MRVTGVIQAGGKSTRMGGRPKALLELGGRRIIDRVVAAIAGVVNDLLLVTNTPELYADLALPMVGDAYPDHGSLGGIFSGLAAASGDAVFTVACDMPFLHPEVARLVVGRAGEADVVIPRVGRQLETLHAVYGKRCLAPIEARLRAGQLKITGFFADVRVVEVSEAEVARYGDPTIVFMNVNTPEELARARGIARPIAPESGAPSASGPALAPPDVD
jgi:molybdopterin-guanine dinucleotide biosynthesis protein A